MRLLRLPSEWLAKTFYENAEIVLINPLSPPILGGFKAGGNPQTPSIRLRRTAPLF